MILAIQASHVDHERLPRMAELLAKFGPYPGHQLALIHTQDVPPQSVAEFIAKVKGLFDQVENEAITTSSRTWPMGCNQAFQKMMAWAAKKNGPIYNFELDNVPVKKGWLTELQKELEASGKPFMGVIVETRGLARDPDGKLVSVKTGERHMVGTGIYPASYGRTSVKIPFISRHMMWAGGQPQEPYDVQIRHEVVSKAHHTSLIAHRFKTVNYRLEDGQLVCDNLPNNPAHADHAAPIPYGTAVVHGVKDDSLAKLVLDGLTIPKPEPKTAPLAPSEPETTEVPPSSPSADSKDTPSFIAFKVATLLKSSEQAWRINKLAEHMKLDIDQLRKEIEHPSSGLEVVNPGWVRIKTPSQSAA